MKFGNLGNIYYNLALYQSIVDHCYENMVAVISFAMIAIPRYQQIKSLFTGDKSKCSGDIEIAGSFFLELAQKMDLTKIKTKDVDKKFYSLRGAKKLENIASPLIRVLKQMKRLLEVHRRSMSTNDWSIVNRIIASTFKNNLYFNRSMIGGNKNYFEKLVDDMVYHPNQPI